MDNEVIITAKEYAITHEVSLSRLVERYFSYLSQESIEIKSNTPIVDGLLGIAKNHNKEINSKTLLKTALNKKFLK